MESMIISTQILPLTLRKRIHAPNVSVTEQNGGVMLLPVAGQTKGPTGLFGMFVGSGLSSTDFSRQKQTEKGFE